jgi:hypothetical protein
MTHISRSKSLNFSCCGLMIFALVLAGCDREKIKVQDVPKDSEQSIQLPPMQTAAEQRPAIPANPHGGMAMDMGGNAAQPQLKWTLPSGWKDKALSQMRVGSFDAPGKEGQSADVSIIPLPTTGPETELPYYNMWRSELKLDPAEKVSSDPVAIGPGKGKLYEIADGKSPGRIIVAALDQDGVSWFFKIRGDDATVRDQKPAFLEFLKSISFEAAPAMAMADPHAGMTMPAGSAPTDAAANAGGPLPVGWKEIPNPQMLLAKYVIQGSGDAKAEVNISMLAGQGGGVMMNVTRWRGQLGLSPMSEEDFSRQAATLDVGGNKATVVDMTGTDAKTGKKSRLIGVVAPQSGNTWFYKLMGDEQIVEQQKDAFTKFIQTAKFGN